MKLLDEGPRHHGLVLREDCARRAAEAAPPSRPSARHGAYESSSRLYIASAVRSGATPSPSGESEHATIAG